MIKPTILMLTLAFNLNASLTSIDKYNNMMDKLKNIDNDFIKINHVNSYFNNFKYISDIEQFKKNDYWMSLNEFLTNKQGDCEDFAIAKYFTLKKLGVKHLNFILGSTSNENHIILQYKTKQNNYVLDNKLNKVIKFNKLTNFRPIFYFDEQKISVFNKDTDMWKYSYINLLKKKIKSKDYNFNLNNKHSNNLTFNLFKNHKYNIFN